MWEALFLLLWLSPAELRWKKTTPVDETNMWPDWYNAGKLPQRVLELIAGYNQRGAAQINAPDVIGVRARHEDTPQFEMGYVMSEILNRYRQMVGLAQRGVQSKMESVFEMIKHTELIQKLFFEIFHLVNMFHEINLKFGQGSPAGTPVEAAKGSPADAAAAMAQVNKMLERQKEIDKIRKMEKKKRLKQMKKDRESFIKYGKVPKRKDRKPRNRWWPIDYGWEVDYKWW